MLLNSKLIFPIKEIAKKEFSTFFYTKLAWIILVTLAIVNGLFGFWIIEKSATSNKAIQLVFYVFSSMFMISAALLSMKLFSEEKLLGTFELLITSPITEWQMVIGKFLGALAFLFIVFAVSMPVPMIILFFGDAHLGHFVSGYLGVLLLSSSCMAITTFYSTLTNSQLVAAILGGANIIIFLLLGFFSPYVSPPLKLIMRELSLYIHYMDFEKGVIVLKHVLFFISIIVLYLSLAVISLNYRKWK